MAKILLVEDDINLSEIYQARMEAEGYQVVAASDGENALAIAAKEKPDLIVSDVMMPKISGFEMLDILRNTEGLKHARIIMLTALGQAEDKVRADALGADRYLVKSQVTLEDIVSAAKELLGETTPPSPAELAAAPSTASPTAPSIDTPVADTPVAQEPVEPAPVQAAPAEQLPATEPAPLPQPVAATVSEPATASPAVDDVATSNEATATSDAAAQPPPNPEPVAPLTELLPQPAAAAVEPQPQPAPAQPPAPAPAAEPTQPVAEEPVSAQPAPAASDEAALPMPSPATPAPEPTPALPSDDTASTAATAEQAPQPAPQPQPVAATPAPVAEAPVSAAVIDEHVVAKAIDKLLAKTPVGQQISSDVSPTSGSEHPHQKIIAPITPPAAAPDPAAASDPDLAALAQAQAAKAAKDKPGFDPNSISL